MTDIVDDDHFRAATYVKRLLAAYEDARDLISIGAYQTGADPRVDEALELMDEIRTFLNQDSARRSSLEETQGRLAALAGLGERD